MERKNAWKSYDENTKKELMKYFVKNIENFCRQERQRENV